MTDERNNLEDREGRMILDDLGRIGRAIDREKYPGVAWQRYEQPRRRRILRIVFPAVATAAAAAVVLLVAASFMNAPNKRQRIEDNQTVRKDAGTRQTYSDAPMDWSIPTDMAPSAATCMIFEVPQFSLITTSGADPTDEDSVEWSLPSLSLPVMPDADAGWESLNDA